MINKKQVVETFSDFLMSKIDVQEINIGGGQVVDVETFLKYFGDADNLTYKDLTKKDPDNKLNYKSFFDKCKEEGILK